MRGERRPGRARSSPVGEPPSDVEPQADAEPESVARTICLRLLTARARTRVELEEALAAREVPTAAAVAVLDRLTAVGLIDDDAFAESFTRSRFTDRGLAPREIVRQLKQKGVAGERAERAVEAITVDDEYSAALALVTKRARSLRGLPVPVQTRRLVGLLARKGFSSSLSYAVVREAVQGAETVDVMASGADVSGSTVVDEDW